MLSRLLAVGRAAGAGSSVSKRLPSLTTIRWPFNSPVSCDVPVRDAERASNSRSSPTIPVGIAVSAVLVVSREPVGPTGAVMPTVPVTTPQTPGPYRGAAHERTCRIRGPFTGAG